MKESQFIGTLMPSHPDFQPILQKIRAKYQPPEVDTSGESIDVIYLGEEIVPLGDFRQENGYARRCISPISARYGES